MACSWIKPGFPSNNLNEVLLEAFASNPAVSETGGYSRTKSLDPWLCGGCGDWGADSACEPISD